MKQEPVIAVGLVDNASSIAFELSGEFTDRKGTFFPPGRYLVSRRDGKFVCTGPVVRDIEELCLTGTHLQSGFRLHVTIGIDFHWEQRQWQTFSGALRFLRRPGERVAAINDVPLETYILSVSCSEMNGNSPEEFLKAHSIISRSWLLAQLTARQSPQSPAIASSGKEGEIIRWYDRQSHRDFDVCADDHCQRYQGTGMITSGAVAEAVNATRGTALMFGGTPCDARFSKCCGGVTEDFRIAWDDTVHPYLVPVSDSPEERLPNPPLTDESAARGFITGSPGAWCNCKDETILGRVLNNYDYSTGDFFRWSVRLTHGDLAKLLRKKLSLDLGRIVGLVPVNRGLSGRIERLRIVGEGGDVIIGKELEIRRALSPTHLYSSAFVVDTEGPHDRPDAFVLRGAGWGHGVGLCQIGAAVMACRGIGYRDILAHYYPGSELKRLYC